MGLDDEAAPWPFWVLAPVHQRRIAATTKASLCRRMNDSD